MFWDDKAIVLSARKFGEHGLLVKLFSAQHGVFSGLVKGGAGRRQRGIWQQGNIVQTHWQARLSEQLGTLRGDLSTAVAALVMQNSQRLLALSSICAILETVLHEREPHPELFSELESFLHQLRLEDSWPLAYIRLERDILSLCGFGLDLSTCAVTGQDADLTYVSPRSGRAVSRDAGRPYHEKLLPLPSFLLETKDSCGFEPYQILDGLALTGYFLERWLYSAHGGRVPPARQRLIQQLERNYTLTRTDIREFA